MFRIGKASGIRWMVAALAMAIAGCTTRHDAHEIANALMSGEYARAEHPLKQLADSGDQGAQYNLAVIQLNGLTGRRDEGLAAHYFLLASAQGHAQAQVEIGKLYEAGVGVPQDPEEAIGWYKLAAHQENAEAQYRLAQLYERELGSVRQRDLAMKWYRRAAEQGYGDAQHRLLLMETRPRIATVLPDRSRFAVSRTSTSDLSKLALLDQRARDAKATLNGIAKNNKAELAAAQSRYDTLEAEVSATRDELWRALPYTRASPVMVADPLLLAVLDLHIEVRRSLGPNHRTHVSGLIADPGCAGDIVADRMLLTYGQAALRQEETGANDPPADVLALRDIAAQIACLSVRQLADFEAAVTNASAAVIARIQARRLNELVTAFVQRLAPVQLLLFDARKHRGQRSFAWRWFYEHGPQIKAAAAQSSWGTDGRIYVWDRVQASLIGFPTCLPNAPLQDCVDVASFVDSLGDPRAIGLGDCAVAGMLALGRTRIEGDVRYTCPWAPCGPGGTPAGGDEQTMETRRQEVNSIWSSFPQQRAPSDGNCLSGTGGYASQGAHPEMATDCIDDLFKHSENPWDTYASCMAEGRGGESPETFGSLPGVPMGNECKLADYGAPERGGFRPRHMIWDDGAGQYRPAKEQEIPLTMTAPSTPSREDIERARIEAETKAKQEAQAKEQEKQKQENEQQQKDEKEKDPNKRKGQASGSCVEFSDCDKSCTGLGAQIARAKHCTEDLLNSFAEALGRPSREPGRMRKIDIYANYHPDDAPVDLSKAPVCIPGGQAVGGPRRGPTACRLILCPDTGLAAAAVGEMCNCGRGAPSFIPQRAACPAIRCTEDQILTNDCLCAPIGRDPGPGTPPGGPIDMRNLPPGVR